MSPAPIALAELHRNRYFEKQRELQDFRSAVLLALPAVVFYFLTKWPPAGWRPLLIIAGGSVFRYSLFGSLVLCGLYWRAGIRLHDSFGRAVAGGGAVLIAVHALIALSDMHGTLAAGVLWELPVPLLLLWTGKRFTKAADSAAARFWNRLGVVLTAAWIVLLLQQLLYAFAYVTAPPVIARSLLVFSIESSGAAARFAHWLLGWWAIGLLLIFYLQRHRIYPELPEMEKRLTGEQ